MSVESYLSSQLQKFNIVDFACVKTVYFLFGLLIFSLYSPLASIDWWFYLIFLVFTAFPLEVHLFSQKGGYVEKMHHYLKTNNPSNQVLLFLSIFFFTCMLAVLIPVLASATWWVYLILMAIFAIKPMTKSWYW
jgi:fatty acid desaturase